MSVVLRILPP